MYNPITLSKNISPVHGDKISVNVTEPQHFIDSNTTLADLDMRPSSNSDSPFYRNLIDIFNSLNNEIVTADHLTERFLVEPEKVNVHDVMIALQKSKLNLDLTRTVIQKSIEGYNTLINLR